MADAQKPEFVFRRNERVHLNRRGRQFSRLLAAELCASAVVMLDTPCSEVVWRVLAAHSIRQFPLHFPSNASPCAITFQLESTAAWCTSESVSACYCDKPSAELKDWNVWNVTLMQFITCGMATWVFGCRNLEVRTMLIPLPFKSLLSLF